MKVDTLVVNTLGEAEALRAKEVYVGSEEQALTYTGELPAYARVIADLIASMRPGTVLEFGCNAGRNLDLIRERSPETQLFGVDVNQKSIERGRELYGLDLRVADESWLAEQPENCFDVSLTVSAIDHMPYPETVLRDLLRVTRHYLVLFELSQDRIGKATHNLYLSDDGATTTKTTYRYSYIHDYRHECERKFGARCLIDAHFPIGEDNLLDLYRLYVFSKCEHLRTRPALQSLAWAPITKRAGSDPGT